MGNKNSRSRRSIQPAASDVLNPIVTNTIEIKSKQVHDETEKEKEKEKEKRNKCNLCNKTGNEFTVVSRDGTTFTKMYYCRTCSIHWKH
jgi:hypothetical protein